MANSLLPSHNCITTIDYAIIPGGQIWWQWGKGGWCTSFDDLNASFDDGNAVDDDCYHPWWMTTYQFFCYSSHKKLEPMQMQPLIIATTGIIL